MAQTTSDLSILKLNTDTSLHDLDHAPCKVIQQSTDYVDSVLLIGMFLGHLCVTMFGVACHGLRVAFVNTAHMLNPWSGPHTQMSLFPPISPIDHDGDNHFEAPRPCESRSPCPALNMLANHGLLPRDGVGIQRKDLIHALRQGFRLSYPLAWLITTGGYLLVGQVRFMSLDDLCRHNGIEHDASLVHFDTHKGNEYAPRRRAMSLLNHFKQKVQDKPNVTLLDFAKLRVKREAESQTTRNQVLDNLHAEIARGEVALTIGVFGDARTETIEHGRLFEMWRTERFPDQWQPTHTQTLAQTALTAQNLQHHMLEEKSEGPIERSIAQKVLKTYVDNLQPFFHSRLDAVAT